MVPFALPSSLSTTMMLCPASDASGVPTSSTNSTSGPVVEPRTSLISGVGMSNEAPSSSVAAGVGATAPQAARSTAAAAARSRA